MSLPDQDNFIAWERYSYFSKWYFIATHLTEPWQWAIVSKNINITFDIIKQNTHIPWNWAEMSYNPNLTIENVIEYADKDWDWNILSIIERGFPIKTIAKYSYLPWNRRIISNRKDLILADIRKYPNFGWDRRSHHTAIVNAIKDNII